MMMMMVISIQVVLLNKFRGQFFTKICPIKDSFQSKSITEHTKAYTNLGSLFFATGIKPDFESMPLSTYINHSAGNA